MAGEFLIIDIIISLSGKAWYCLFGYNEVGIIGYEFLELNVSLNQWSII